MMSEYPRTIIASLLLRLLSFPYPSSVYSLLRSHIFRARTLLMDPLPTTPLTLTPTAGNLVPLKAGRFTIESSRHSRSRSDLASEERLDDLSANQEHSSVTGSILPGSAGSPGQDNSPVNRVGRFAVATKDTDIRRNVQANNSRRMHPVQDTLSSLGMQIQSLLDRNAYLESENARLTREIESLQQPIHRGARAPSVKSETS
jgi:hypothetical protein